MNVDNYQKVLLQSCGCVSASVSFIASASASALFKRAERDAQLHLYPKITSGS